MGLSICYSIVEALEGQPWALQTIVQDAVLQFILRSETPASADLLRERDANHFDSTASHSCSDDMCRGSVQFPIIRGP